MKLRIKYLIVFISISIFIFNNYSYSQVFKYHELNKVLSDTNKNIKAKIEYRASEIFHLLLNDYRKKNELNELEYNKYLWLASRNHNLWMIENKKLGHEENKISKCFTGKNPGDRLDFVVKGNCGWTAENCLYNFSYTEGDTVENIARQIAELSFEQWRNSKGHNYNMLGQHYEEETSFYISKFGVVWATSLFGFCNDEKSKTKINKSIIPKAKVEPILPEKYRVFDIVSTRKQINKKLKYKYNEHNILNEKYLQIAASKSMQNKNSCENVDQKNLYELKKRINRSGNLLSYFSNINNYTEYQFCKDYIFDKNIYEDIEKDLELWLNNIDFNKLKSTGHDIRFYKSNNKITLYISLVAKMKL